MKDNIENFILQAISKLDTTTVILLLPCVLIIYICLFVPNEDIEKILGIENNNKENVEIVEINVKCPHCGKTFVYYHAQPKNEDNVINDIVNENVE